MLTLSMVPVGMMLVAQLLMPIAPGLQLQTQDEWHDLSTIEGCTSFCFDNNGYAIYGTNFDYVKDRHSGLVLVNKRGLAKVLPQPDSLSRHVNWTSRFGSVSFNLIASQTPWGGMNEAGLVISLMRLEESRCPEPDERLWIQTHYWMQYILDNCSTIQEVIASDSSMRTVSSGRVPHYLVCDRHGNCATIEFLRGRMVTHSGGTLPLKVLANTIYDSSLMELHQHSEKQAEGKRPTATGTSSRSRFIRAAEGVMAFRPAPTDSAVATAFDLLARTSGQDVGNPTPCWSIVFDTRNLQVHFRTIAHSGIRTIDMARLDFSCRTPAKMIDINEKLSGDITDRLRDFSFDVHLEHAVRAGKKWDLKMNSRDLRDLFESYEEWRCHSDSL